MFNLLNNNIVMNKGIFVVLMFFLISCHHNNNEKKDINDMEIGIAIQESDTIYNSSLMLLIHSGHVRMLIQGLDTTVVSETQIIYCTPTSLKYGYGSVLTESDTLKNDVEWFTDYSKIEDYSIKERNLDTREQMFVQNAIKNLSNIHYESPIIVKDDWEYILYINNLKVASGYVSSIDSFPQNIKESIEQLLKMASPLYSRNAFA